MVGYIVPDPGGPVGVRSRDVVDAESGDARLHAAALYVAGGVDVEVVLGQARRVEWATLQQRGDQLRDRRADGLLQGGAHVVLRAVIGFTSIAFQ